MSSPRPEPGLERPTLQNRAGALPSAGDLGRMVALYLVYWPLEQIVGRASRLPADSYQQPVVLVELLRQFAPWPYRGLTSAALALAATAAVALCIAQPSSMFARWSRLEWADLRPIAAVMIVLVAWSFSTYSYNLYVDQGHLVDRLLMVGFGVLAVLRPVFIIPLVALGLALMSQFFHPLGVFSPSHLIVPFRVLLLVSAALIVRALGVRLLSWHVVAAMMALVASGYLISGLDKLRLGWAGLERVANVLAAAHASGWLRGLDTEQISALGSVLVVLNPVLVIWTLGQELGMSGLFWGRRTAIGLLLFAAGFHLAILSISGIFFWMWIAVDLTLALFLLRLPSERAASLFARRTFVASLFLLPLSVVWFRPLSLSWIDVPVSYTYRFEATGESGERYALPPTRFAPFEYVFTLGGFEAYVREPLLPIRWGGASPEVARALRDVVSSDQVVDIERRIGASYFDEDAAAITDDFVRQWLGTLARRGDRDIVPRLLRAPLQLQTDAPGRTYTGHEPICRVDVRLVRSFFDGRRYHEFGETDVRSIRLTASNGCPATD